MFLLSNYLFVLKIESTLQGELKLEQGILQLDESTAKKNRTAIPAYVLLARSNQYYEEMKYYSDPIFSSLQKPFVRHYST